ncbi:hypothetical protein B6N60_03653 [Richelia sinica FACHB-800]|uniref:Uncharacterized protein n=1 Tax=Richelia sinica FACHB-800 TaxID=1357546 RepID=A0A975Y664_9NOST|nr:hypothetical protein B6N60_03653 [Richelia sinica FACHB-800]
MGAPLAKLIQPDTDSIRFYYLCQYFLLNLDFLMVSGILGLLFYFPYPASV